VFEKNPALVDHMKSLSAYIDEMQPEDAAKIGIRILYFAEVVTRDYLFAIELCKKFKTLLDSGAVSDPFVIGAFYNWYGDTVLINGSVDKSIDAFKRAYEALKRADPEESRHELILLLSDHLGFFHHWKGDLVAVEGYLNEAKALYAGQDNLLLAAALEELDVVLKQDKGQFEETLPILDNLTAALEKDPAVNKVGGHFVKSLKACSLLKLAQLKSINGQKDEAKALREKAYAVAQDAYQHARASADGHENHEIVGRVLVYLSQAQSALGMYKEAEKSALQAIKNLDDDLVKTHVIRRQGVAHMALGDAYMGQKKYDAAFKEYKEAEDIFTEISSHKAFDDMSEVWARLVDNAIVRGDANTARRCLSAHKETFDGLHPRYIVMAAKVASV
ncbi:MAG: hypothetical protein C0514_08440, partial [Candidatus Puniceispirillum sp.]|nr:hypothetical protein [Candidatus Puniceispirillum sp.]